MASFSMTLDNPWPRFQGHAIIRRLISLLSLIPFLPHDAVQARPNLSCGVCLSICLSRSRILSKRVNISSIFFSFSSHTILVFPHQTLRQYSDGDPHNGGAECRCGKHKSRFWANIGLHRVLSTLRQAGVINAVPPWQVVTLIAGSKRRSLLMAADDDVMFMARSFNVTQKTTEQHSIARNDKSVAYVTNNKRLRSTFCTIEANYWQTRSIARPLWLGLVFCCAITLCNWLLLSSELVDNRKFTAVVVNFMRPKLIASKSIRSISSSGVVVC